MNSTGNKKGGIRNLSAFFPAGSTPRTISKSACSFDSLLWG